MPETKEQATQERLVNRQVTVAALLPSIIPPEVDKDFPTGESCILSSRVTFDALKHYGVRVRALPVYVQIFNRAVLDRVKKEGRWPASPDEMQQWAAQDGSWGIGIGRTGKLRPGRWDGHLVVLGFYTEPDETTDGVLFDMSLQQSSRPRHDIRLQAHSTLTPAGFLGGEPLIMEQDGSWIRYAHFPEGGSFHEAPDWREKTRREFIVKRVIAKLDLALAAEGL